MWLDLGDYRGPSRFHAFVMYAIARRRQREVTLAYRTYVSDSLQNAPKGMALTRRFADMIRPREEIDADAIIEHVISITSQE